MDLIKKILQEKREQAYSCIEKIIIDKAANHLSDSVMFEKYTSYDLTDFVFEDFGAENLNDDFQAELKNIISHIIDDIFESYEGAQTAMSPEEAKKEALKELCKNGIGIFDTFIESRIKEHMQRMEPSEFEIMGNDYFETREAVDSILERLGVDYYPQDFIDNLKWVLHERIADVLHTYNSLTRFYYE